MIVEFLCGEGHRHEVIALRSAAMDGVTERACTTCGAVALRQPANPNWQSGQASKGTALGAAVDRVKRLGV